MTEYSNSCLLSKIVEFDFIYKVAVVHVKLLFLRKFWKKYFFRKNGKIVEIKTHAKKSGSSGREESTQSSETTQRQSRTSEKIQCKILEFLGPEIQGPVHESHIPRTTALKYI